MKAVPLDKCKWCNGSGTERAHFLDTGYSCPDCNGTGYAWGPEAVEYVEYLISKEAPEVPE